MSKESFDYVKRCIRFKEVDTLQGNAESAGNYKLFKIKKEVKIIVRNLPM